MKQDKALAWMMAIAITGMTITACSSDSIEPEKPFTTCPVSEATLYACGIGQSASRSDPSILFTEDDIEWFDVSTREIKFQEMSEPLYKRLKPFHEIEFHLGDHLLFVVSSFVGLWDSRVFTNLVLCYSDIGEESSETGGSYYLYDCYPLQFADNNEVKANREKNAGQWELFVYYLEGKGKLKQ